MESSCVSESFSFLIRALATHDRAVLLNIVGKEVVALFADDYRRNIRLALADETFFSAECSLLLLARVLWGLVPTRLFTAMEPNFEALAERSMRDRFGVEPEATLVRNLATVFKRLRIYKLEGRNATSLNLDRPTHRELFDAQTERCALCNYKFTANDIFYETELDTDAVTLLRKAMQDEIVLDRYYRRPQLDHIIPVFIGGDTKKNWQILCASCNVGKGSALAWIFRHGWLPFRNVAELDKLTPSLRYAAICRYIANATSKPIGELRVFKEQKHQLVYLENLKVRDDCALMVPI